KRVRVALRLGKVGGFARARQRQARDYPSEVIRRQAGLAQALHGGLQNGPEARFTSEPNVRLPGAGFPEPSPKRAAKPHPTARSAAVYPKQERVRAHEQAPFYARFRFLNAPERIWIGSVDVSVPPACSAWTAPSAPALAIRRSTSGMRQTSWTR